VRGRGKEGKWEKRGEERREAEERSDEWEEDTRTGR